MKWENTVQTPIRRFKIVIPSPIGGLWLANNWEE